MNAREELESLAREISEQEGFGISFARRLAAEQWRRLLGYAVDWDSWVAEQQRAVHQAGITSLIGEQREVHQRDQVTLIGEQREVNKAGPSSFIGEQHAV